MIKFTVVVRLVAIRPPKPFDFSNTVIARPFSCNKSARVKPHIPAPMTVIVEFIPESLMEFDLARNEKIGLFTFKEK
jgi:hypothetical protein